MLAATNVDGYFSVLLDNAPGNVNASDGNLMLHQSGLVYSSRTVANAVVEIRATLPDVNGNRPTTVTGIFSFPGQSAQTYYWNVDAGAQIGEEVVFRVPVTTDPLSTGRYAWTLDTTYFYGGSSTSPPDYTGHYLHVDRSASEFGKGWYQEELAKLKLESNGFLLVNGDGERYWFNYSGGSYVREAGDPMFYTVTEDTSYLTLTDKYGSSLKFLKNTPTGWARLESTFDASGNEREYNYDVSNRLQSIVDVPTGDTTTFSYAGGLLTTITETVGIRSRSLAVNMFSGQVSSVMLPDPDDFTSSGGSNGPLVSPLWEYSYSGTTGLLTKVVDPVGNVTQQSFGTGSMTDAVTTITQGSKTTTLVPFNSKNWGGSFGSPGVLEGVADSTGQLTDEMNHDTWFCMDTRRFVTEVMDDHQHLTKYERNSENLVTRMIEPDPDDFTGTGGTNGPKVALETTFVYDTRGNMTRETKRGLGSTAVLTQRTWEYPTPDDYSLPIKYVDELGRVTKYTIGAKTGSASERGKILSMVQIVGLEDGSLVAETDDARTTYTYTTVAGHVGLLEKATDALGRVTKHEYFTADPHEGLLKKVTYNDGAQLNTSVSYEYDDFRNRKRFFDELNRQTDFAFDRLDRLIKRTDPDPDAGGLQVVETEFFYDPAGNLIRSIDPLDNVTSTIYDPRHRMAEQILPRPESTAAQVEFRDEQLTSSNGTWTVSSPGYEGDHRYQAAGTGGYTQWSATNLAANKRYEVFVTWQSNPLNASDALYEVRDVNDTVLDSFQVNQQRAPTYEYDSVNNVWWQPLGTFFNKTTLKVRLSQNASGRVVADAVRIVEVGPATRYEYDDAGNPVSITDALGNTTDYEFDEMNRLKLMREPSPDGIAPRPETKTEYWADGAVKQVTDPMGHVTQYTYDQLARNTEVIQPDPDGAGTVYTSPIMRYKYDAAGQMTYATLTDAAAALTRTTQYFYDGLGRQSAMAQPLPVGTPAEIKVNNQTTPPTNWTRDTTSGYQGDHLWRNAGSASEYAEWSFTGLDTTKTYAVYATWVVKYDANNQPENASNARYEVYEGTPPNAIRKGKFFVNQKYAPADELTDTNVNWSRLGLYKPTSSGISVRLYADADGKLVADGVRLVELGPVTKTVYNKTGNLVMTVDPLAHETIRRHDDLDRLINEYAPPRDPSVPPYRPQIVDNHISISGWSLVYDERASSGDYLRHVSGTNPEYFVLTIPPNYLNRSYAVLATWAPSDDNINAVTIKVEDANDKTVAEVKIDQRLEPADYLDETGRWWEVIGTFYNLPPSMSELYVLPQAGAQADAARIIEIGPNTQFGRDAVGNLTSLSDSSNTTTFTYDPLNRLKTETNPYSKARSYEYDVAGNLKKTTLRHSSPTKSIEYLYDNLYRRTDEDWKDGTSTVRSFDFTYDLMGRPLTATDPAATYTNTYDTLGRNLQTTSVIAGLTPSVVINQVWDADNRRTELRSTVGGVADFKNNYTYDNADRVSQITQQGVTGGRTVANKRVIYNYNAAGQVTNMARYSHLVNPAGVMATNYGFDAIGRVTSMSHYWSSTLAAYSSTLDAAGRVTNTTRSTTIPGVGTVYEYGAYAYDRTNQLISVNHTGTSPYTENYVYDFNGNRAVADGVTYTNTTNNRISNDGTYLYTYDDEGNVTAKKLIANQTVATYYVYDHRNRMTRAYGFNSNGWLILDANYTYDAFNRRVKEAVDPDGYQAQPTDTTFSIYDGDDVVLVTTSTGALRNRYLHGPAVDEILADENASNGVLWALPDQFHSVRDLVDQLGTLYNHIDYNTFGKVVYQWSNGSGLIHAYGFQSREWDRETDLNYHRNRYYNRSLGRWMSEDPIGFAAGDSNLNRFVGNGPTNLTDPYGEQARRRRIGARGSLYAELRNCGYGYAVDNAHQIHLQLQQDLETATRFTPGVGDAISAIEIVTGQNAFHHAQNLTFTQRVVEAGLFGLPNILELGSGIIRHLAHNADDFGFGRGAARLPTGGARVVDPPGALQHQATGGVYVLRDPETGKVIYTGRTSNLPRRENDHLRDPRFPDFEFDPIYPTDVYDEQRGLEQIVYDAHQPPYNRINPISCRNPNRQNYIDAGEQYINQQRR